MSTRLRLPILMGLFFALAACPAPEDDPVERAAAAVATAVPRAGVAAELALVRAQLRNHRRLQGDWPAAIADVETLGHLKYADDYLYDAGTGEVRSRTFPGL